MERREAEHTIDSYTCCCVRLTDVLFLDCDRKLERLGRQTPGKCADLVQLVQPCALKRHKSHSRAVGTSLKESKDMTAAFSCRQCCFDRLQVAQGVVTLCQCTEGVYSTFSQKR